MTTEERMMIMGMCLQGLLGNPSMTGHGGNPMDSDFMSAQIRANIALAHRYADALAPQPETTDAERIAGLTRVCYEACRAANLQERGGGYVFTVPFDDARTSTDADAQDALDNTFDRVSRWFKNPVGVPRGPADTIIAAIVAASRHL